jgi:tRNA(adenine34) deaminase
MWEALSEAEAALKLNEVPIGAVIVRDGIIIGRGHNMVETLKDSTAHAEIMAIKDASKNIDNWRLSGCEMYVTLEPCSMCAGAISLARIRKLYIGAADTDAGACGSVINVIQNEGFSHWIDVKWTYNEMCSKILSDFFKNKRGYC